MDDERNPFVTREQAPSSRVVVVDEQAPSSRRFAVDEQVPSSRRFVSDEQEPSSRRSVELVGAPSWRSSARRLSVSSQILDVLQDFGATTIFGIPGGAVGALYGALAKRDDFRIVNAKHETGAVFLAMGHFLATGRPGVVITTSGPGVTNALTGLASAFYEGIPLVLLCGEVATSAFGRGALQEGSQNGLDVLSLVRSISKFSQQLTRADTAAAVFRKALLTSMNPRRGPVVLTVPMNVLAGEVTEAAPMRGTAHTSFQVPVDGCRRAMELLAGAKHPFIFAGAGARDPRSREALKRLVELTGAPIAVSPKGKGVFPEDHPQYLGIFGFGGHESVINYLNKGADIVMVCGSGLNDFSTNAWSTSLNASTAFIQLDIDAAQLGKNYPIDLGLLGPMHEVLDQMIAEASGLTMEFKSAGESRTPFGAVTQAVRPSPAGMLTTAQVVLAMNEHCPHDSVFTSDMGEHLSMALHYLKVRDAGDFITCLGFGSMGSGICSAVGYQMGAPSRRVYAICGDGCFLMHGLELATAVQHQIPVTLIVINDNRLNMCEHGIRDQYGSTTDMTTQVIDFAAIASGMGATGIIVRTRDELVKALTAKLLGPTLLDVRVDPSIRLEGNQRIASLQLFTLQ